MKQNYRLINPNVLGSVLCFLVCLQESLQCMLLFLWSFEGREVVQAFDLGKDCAAASLQSIGRVTDLIGEASRYAMGAPLLVDRSGTTFIQILACSDNVTLDMITPVPHSLYPYPAWETSINKSGQAGGMCFPGGQMPTEGAPQSSISRPCPHRSPPGSTSWPSLLVRQDSLTNSIHSSIPPPPPPPFLWYFCWQRLAS